MKKNNLYLAALLLGSLTANAQVGIGTTTPAASSILELSAANKGFLLPRMTTGNRTAITAPARGLQVFDTTTNTVWYHNGTAWINSSATTADNLGNHSATQDLALNGFPLLLGAPDDENHKVVFDPAGGPLITGYSGGALASERNLRITALTWKEGNVGIGTALPVSKLEVNGASTNTVALAATTRVIDFALSNLAYTTASAGTFELQNMKNGGTYSLNVRSTAAGTSTFTAAGFTVKFSNNRATTVDTETLYTFVVMGTTVYAYIATGF